ncbi:hypothetical protein [Streptomyces sp. NPDC018031]|uniref:hypothetical protein n=1 Tax=Streptomyces sp. NPDC018031 TaxID=3365033 RepID=UPI0037973EB3
MSQPPPPHQPPAGPGTPRTAPHDPSHRAPGGYPAPDPHTGGGRRADRRRRSSPSKGIVIGVVTVALLAAGGVVLAVQGGDDDGASDGQQVAEARVLGSVPMPAGLEKGDPVPVPGLWTTGENFVKGDVNKIVGYPLKGGAASWEIPLGGRLCQASPRVTEDGMAAVLFEKPGKDQTCTQVGLVDLNKGKLVWKREATDSWGSVAGFDSVTIGGGTVAAAAEVGDGGAGWTLDGEPAWKLQTDKECEDIGYAGGADKIIAIQQCGDADVPPLDVQTVDPKTRAVTSTYRLPEGVEDAFVLSTDPLVVGTAKESDDAATGFATLLAIDDGADEGKLRSETAIPAEKFETDCDARSVEICKGVVVSKAADAAYVATTQDVAADVYNEIVAFDLKTGEEAGRTPGLEGVNLHVLGLDEDGSVIAYQETDLSGEAGGIWRIDPASHRKTQVFRTAAEFRDKEAAFEAGGVYHYANKRLYIGEELVSGEENAVDKDHPLAVVIGTG